MIYTVQQTNVLVQEQLSPCEVPKLELTSASLGLISMVLANSFSSSDKIYCKIYCCKHRAKHAEARGGLSSKLYRDKSIKADAIASRKTCTMRNNNNNNNNNAR